VETEERISLDQEFFHAAARRHDVTAGPQRFRLQMGILYPVERCGIEFERIVDPGIAVVEDKGLSDRFFHFRPDHEVREGGRGGEDEIERRLPVQLQRARDRTALPSNLVVGQEEGVADAGKELSHTLARELDDLPVREDAPRTSCGSPGDSDGRLVELLEERFVVRDVAGRLHGQDRRVPSERGEVLDELGRPLDAAQAHGREVIRNDKNPTACFHAQRIISCFGEVVSTVQPDAVMRTSSSIRRPQRPGR